MLQNHTVFLQGVNKDKVNDKGRMIIKVTKWALRAFQNDDSVGPHRLNLSRCSAKQCLIKRQCVRAVFLFFCLFPSPTNGQFKLNTVVK